MLIQNKKVATWTNSDRSYVKYETLTTTTYRSGRRVSVQLGNAPKITLEQAQEFLAEKPKGVYFLMLDVSRNDKAKPVLVYSLGDGQDAFDCINVRRNERTDLFKKINTGKEFDVVIGPDGATTTLNLIHRSSKEEIDSFFANPTITVSEATTVDWV